MSGGGKIRLLWDRDETAAVTIRGAGGQTSNRFSVNGSPITFPYTLTDDVTFATETNDTYAVSVVLQGIDIADDPDGPRTVVLHGGTSELVFAPVPNDGFVSPTAPPTPGASETAYFVGTLVSATNVSDVAVPLEVLGSPVAWATVNEDGAVVLDPETAGGTIVSLSGQSDFDYSATTAPTAPGGTNAFYDIKLDGGEFATTSILTDGTTTAGDGSDLVTTAQVGPDGGLVFPGTLVAYAGASAFDDNSGPITDGVVTHRVAVNVTRQSPSPVPPSA